MVPSDARVAAVACRRRYPTDLSDAEWGLVEPLIPPVKPGGRPALHQRREIVDALAYWLRAGCAWRLLPHDLPPWKTVYHYFRTWRLEGRGSASWPCCGSGSACGWAASPAQRGDHRQPERQDHRKRGAHGYDGGKKVNGRKRHLLVDTLGNVLKVM